MAAATEQFVPLNDDKPKLSRSDSHGSSSDVDLAAKGEGLDYRIHAVDKRTKGKVVSLWHDISLVHMDPVTDATTPYLNFVCEIPKFTRKKYEIATDEEGNPIKQDEKKGTLREFKKGDIFFNYGCFPQTWEDPTHEHPDCPGCRGDNDPLDVCEIGARIVKPGDIRPVKVLGILCMIDEGECDWKVIVIDAEDKWAPYIDDIDDVEEQLPGLLSAIREWYRTYKIPDGKPPNTFALDERFMNKAYAEEIVHECHAAWDKLVSGTKHREIEGMEDDAVKGLVRKLSTGTLSAMAHNLEPHPEVHPEDYTEVEEEDTLTF